MRIYSSGFFLLTLLLFTACRSHRMKQVYQELDKATLTCTRSEVAHGKGMSFAFYLQLPDEQCSEGLSLDSLAIGQVYLALSRSSTDSSLFLAHYSFVQSDPVVGEIYIKKEPELTEEMIKAEKQPIIYFHLKDKHGKHAVSPIITIDSNY